MNRLSLAIILASSLALFGCSSNGAVDTPSQLQVQNVVASPLKGRITLRARAIKPVGKVVAVHVSIANGTDRPVKETTTQIYALAYDGNRVPSMSPAAAESEAGGAAGLASTVKTAAAYGVPSAAAGAGVGALIGLALAAGGGPILGPVVAAAGLIGGAMVGAGAGLAAGSAYGAYKAGSAADAQARQEVNTLALKSEAVVNSNATESGYVFFPNGNYQKIQAVLADAEAQTSVTVTEDIQKD